MKKNFKAVLAVILLVVFTGSAFAESAVGFTPEDVLRWLEDDDKYAEDATQQSVNASYRLAEMLVYVDGLNANEENLETLQSILDTLNELSKSEDLSAYQCLASGCVQVVRALVVLANEADPNGVYGDTLQEIVDTYNAGNDAVETADGQTVNALYTAMKLTTLVVKESCTSQDQIDQIDAGLAEFDAENEAAGDIYDQMAVCAKWLRKMLGAFAKLNNPNCAGDIDIQMERVENYISSDQMSSEQTTFQYLCASIYAMAIFTGYMTMEE